MKLNVKILGGDKPSCTVEAEPEDSVESLRKKLETQLKLDTSKTESRLVFRGKTLQDGTVISTYKLVDGDKIHLMLKKLTAGVSTPATETSKNGQEISLDSALNGILRKYCQSDEDAKKITTAFKRILNERIASMNLDDIERLCYHLNHSDSLEF